jgi:hypothetical protein
VKTKLKPVKYAGFLLKNPVAVITLHVKYVNINGVGYAGKNILEITLVLG